MNIKAKIASAGFCVLLASIVCAPAAFADAGDRGAHQLHASGALSVQASNTVLANAEEIGFGTAKEGTFELDESRLACDVYWYKFKTTDEDAIYKIRLDLLTSKGVYFSLYNRDGDTRLDYAYANSTNTMSAAKLDKGAWYYVKVGGGLLGLGSINDRSLEGEKYSLSVEKLSADIGNSTVSVDASKLVYDGKEKKPSATVTLDGRTLESGIDYTVAYSKNVKAGKASLTVSGKGDYVGTKTVPFTIGKAANTMRASASTVYALASNLKHGKRVVGKSSAFYVTGAKGKVTFAKKSGNKKIAVAKGGKVTLKKGLKKGAYRVKVIIKAAGNANYRPLSKVVALKVKVR